MYEILPLLTNVACFTQAGQYKDRPSLLTIDILPKEVAGSAHLKL